MHKEMMITVGTSLYHAAMWEPEGPLAKVRGYGDWTTEKTYLEKPGERERHPAARRLASVLDLAGEANAIAEWVEVLHRPLKAGEALPPEQAMRYCGEVATLVRLAAAEGKGLREFLASYHSITVPVDGEATEEGSERRRSLIAGRHLVAAFNEIAAVAVCREYNVPGLASSDPEELGPALVQLFKLAEDRSSAEVVDQIDLVVTGGFKVYGYLFSRLLTFRGTRLHYVHEGGQAVLTLDRDKIEAIVPSQRPTGYSLGFDPCP